MKRFRVFLLMLVAVVAVDIGYTSAQEATDGLVRFKSGENLTPLQQHYLDNINTFEQYVSHRIIQLNTTVLKDNNFVTLQLDVSR